MIKSKSVLLLSEKRFSHRLLHLIAFLPCHFQIYANRLPWVSIEECKSHNLLFSLLPVIRANGQLRRGQCLEVTRAPLLKILLGPSDAETSLHVLLLSGKQFILFFIAAVDALVICVHVHVFCVEVKYSCVSARGVEGIVKVVKLDEENFVKTLLSLRNVAPNFLPIIAPVARDFTLAFCNKLLS